MARTSLETTDKQVWLANEGEQEDRPQTQTRTRARTMRTTYVRQKDLYSSTDVRGVVGEYSRIRADDSA